MFLKAVFLLISTIIGAGVFGLPYVFSRSGLLPSLIGTLFLGLVAMAINLLYVKIILATKGDRQLPGYVKKHLGPGWFKLSVATMIISVNGALLAYVILGGEFLALALGQLSSKFYPLWFYLLALAFFWRDFKSLAKLSALLTLPLIILMLIIPLGLIKFIRLDQFLLFGRQPLSFWGATLFSLIGFSVIPEMEEILRRKKDLLFLGVVIGSLLPVLLYLIFSFSIWGVSGPLTTVDALSGLVQFSPVLVQLGACFGLLALLTSFLSLANVLKEVYFRDLKLEEASAKLLAIAPPFLGIFLSLSSFIKIISLTGVISLTVSGGLISLIAAKLESRLKSLSWLIFSVLVLGLLFGGGW